MKKLIAAILLGIAAPSFASNYQGKLDLGNSDPAAIAFRELHDGMWLVGAQQQIWHLQNNASGNEVFHIAGFWATRLEGQHTAYGPSLGVNIGEAGAAALSKIEVIAPIVSVSAPPWVRKVGDWTSLEVYGGYRPLIGADDHHWIYGIGGKVTIPVSMLYAWASGTQSQGTGVKGL